MVTNLLRPQKPEIANIGKMNAVQSSLKTWQGLLDQFTTALEVKAASSDATTSQFAASVIDSAFASAISAF